MSDVNPTVQVYYQFVRDEIEHPLRDTWEQAADDAVADHSARWLNLNEMKLLRGTINRVRK
jgi:hypothetical protein